MLLFISSNQTSLCRFCLVVHLLFPASVFADVQDLFSSIIAAQSAREAIYHNGHFVFHTRDVSNGVATETRYEYWARENRFFRLDIQLFADGKPKEGIGRTIARPEGYVRIKANDTAELGVIYGYGTTEEGMMSIKGKRVIALGNRHAVLQVQHLIKNWREGRSGFNSFDVNDNDVDAVTISFTEDADDDTYTEEGTMYHKIVLSKVDYRVLSWQYRFEGKKMIPGHCKK